MKKRFANQLSPGESISDLFVLAEKNMGHKKDGAPYLSVVLSDKTGRIQGVVWDNVEQIASRAAAGDFVSIQGLVSEYRGVLQVVVKAMKAESEGIDPSDFLPATGRDPEQMFERLKNVAESLESGPLRELLEKFWQDTQFVKNFKKAPAAKKMHHAYIGGLLEHTLSLVLLAERVAGHYSGIDRDLLIAGAILHDIGKIKEFTYDSRIDYSDEGRLVNHIIIGIRMLEEKMADLPSMTANTALLLKHLVVSHHGTREFGSPEPPKTLEAVLLNYLDEIDSKINGIREFMENQDSGADWTGYHKPLDRFFYRGKPESPA
ncbi:MAG: HD domain-containing protein [Desulfobacteraceae bacterium]|nr:HD domain-containing protein [Desulfobacteraceae bacterium]